MGVGVIIRLGSTSWCRSRRPQQWNSAILQGLADWQVLGGVKTLGSLMPSWRLKKRVEVVTLLFLV